MTPTPTNPTWPRYFRSNISSTVLKFLNEVYGTCDSSGNHKLLWSLSEVLNNPSWREITATEAAEMVAERSKQ